MDPAGHTGICKMHIIRLACSVQDSPSLATLPAAVSVYFGVCVGWVGCICDGRAHPAPMYLTMMNDFPALPRPSPSRGFRFSFFFLGPY